MRMTSQAQLDQLEGWLLEKPIPYISNDNFSGGDSSMVALDLEAG
jgi:hypothetical protein